MLDTIVRAAEILNLHKETCYLALVYFHQFSAIKVLTDNQSILPLSVLFIASKMLEV